MIKAKIQFLGLIATNSFSNQDRFGSGSTWIRDSLSAISVIL